MFKITGHLFRYPWSTAYDFGCHIVVDARWADLLGFSHRTPSGFYREPCKEDSIQLAAALLVKKPCWCQRRMTRLLWADRKATVTQITTHCSQSMQKWMNSQHVERSSRWAAVAEDHTGHCSCQLSTLIWGYFSMVQSEYGVNNMKAWTHLALYQQFRLLMVCSGVGDILLGTLWAPYYQLSIT